MDNKQTFSPATSYQLGQTVWHAAGDKDDRGTVIALMIYGRADIRYLVSWRSNLERTEEPECGITDEAPAWDGAAEQA